MHDYEVWLQTLSCWCTRPSFADYSSFCNPWENPNQDRDSIFPSLAIDFMMVESCKHWKTAGVPRVTSMPRRREFKIYFNVPGHGGPLSSWQIPIAITGNWLKSRRSCQLGTGDRVSATSQISIWSPKDIVNTTAVLVAGRLSPLPGAWQWQRYGSWRWCRVLLLEFWRSRRWNTTSINATSTPPTVPRVPRVLVTYIHLTFGEFP